MRSLGHARLGVALCAVAWLAITASHATTITGGSVINQTWTSAGSPYIVLGDVTIPSGAFLSIGAGTTVLFASTDGQAGGTDVNRVELIVKGTLTVSGTAASPVIFQAQSGTTSGIWFGIEVQNAAVSASIDHAVIRHANNGIHSTAPGTVLTVTNTTVDTCNHAVFVTDGTSSFDSVQTSSSTDGFYFNGKGTVTLTNVIVNSNSDSGVFAYAGTGALTVNLINSTVNGNTNYGVFAGAAGLSNQCQVTVQNDIVTSNGFVGVYRSTTSAPIMVNVTYSDVFGNGTNYSNVVPGAGAISANPNYVGSTDFHLTAGSVAIDTGSGGAGVPSHDFDGHARPLDGDGIGGAQYDMGAYEYVPASIIGSVPEVAGGPQPVLKVSTPDHVSLILTWGASCGAATTDYAVYEGAIGSWYSHLPGTCTSSGTLSVNYAPAPGNRYFLVVPNNASAEGIYGHASSGAPIPVSTSACRATQNTAGCP